MSRTAELEPPSAFDVMVERCKTLRLPMWRWNSEGELTEVPGGWGPAEHWLRSPLLLRMLDQARSRWLDERSHRYLELFPGCWIVPLIDQSGHRSSTTIVTMALSEEAITAEQFMAVCGAARLDAAIMRTALRPIARYSRSDVDQLSMVIAWMHNDLYRTVADQSAIASFTRQLSDTYEHISHLYRLGQSINHLNEPEEFLNMACRYLYEALDFEWISARFVSSTATGGVLNNAVAVAGHLPCDRKRLGQLARGLTRELGDEPSVRVLEPAHNGLAALCGTEVVAVPIFCSVQAVGVLLAGNKRGPDPAVSSIDTQLLSATARYLGSFVYSAAAYNEQRTMFLGTIRAFTHTIEAKDRYTRGHSDRVAHVASNLARACGLSEREVIRVRLAGLLHDVGKIGVPESVLRKPEQLTDKEFALIKRHPVIGYSILRDIGPLHDVLPGVLYHHERWDGNGYPQGLRGEEIPIIARLLAVADTFDAMSSDRAYRSAISRKDVLEEIRDMGGTQLDPDLVKLFLELDLTEYDRLIVQHTAQHEEAA